MSKSPVNTLGTGLLTLNSDDPLNQTIADNATWLATLKESLGIS